MSEESSVGGTPPRHVPSLWLGGIGALRIAAGVYKHTGVATGDHRPDFGLGIPHRARTWVNEEMVGGYWQIEHIVLQQYKTANGGDAVLEQPSLDVRTVFPNIKSLTQDALFRRRQCHVSCRELKANWGSTG